LKHWGRRKISFALEKKGLTPRCITLGLEEIDETEYKQTLKKLLLEKNERLQVDNSYTRRDRLARYAVGKGFEPELIWETIGKLFIK
jgi:regulatory protein